MLFVVMVLFERGSWELSVFFTTLKIGDFEFVRLFVCMFRIFRRDSKHL